ncbi:MAG: hypothetical protein KKB20_13865 [Proteobacteria bacterium]|nr:hypothetical protein [Pseudomonadota bacterium]
MTGRWNPDRRHGCPDLHVHPERVEQLASGRCAPNEKGADFAEQVVVGGHGAAGFVLIRGAFFIGGGEISDKNDVFVGSASDNFVGKSGIRKGAKYKYILKSAG